MGKEDKSLVVSVHNHVVKTVFGTPLRLNLPADGDDEEEEGELRIRDANLAGALRVFFRGRNAQTGQPYVAKSFEDARRMQSVGISIAKANKTRIEFTQGDLTWLKKKVEEVGHLIFTTDSAQVYDALGAVIDKVNKVKPGAEE